MRALRRALLLVSILLLTAGCQSAAKREVRNHLVSYYDALSDRDWDRFREHFWPDATLTTIWQPAGESAERVVVTNVESFIEQAPNGPESKPIFEERMSGAFIILERGLAQAWAAYDARFGDDEAVAEWSGVDAITLLKHDGQWRIVSIVFQPD